MALLTLFVVLLATLFSLQASDVGKKESYVRRVDNPTPIQEITTPCSPSPCGPNAVCIEQNGAGSCTCLPEYIGDPYVGCRPECVLSADCPLNSACIRNKCQDPCPGSCGRNADCQVVNHLPVCTCYSGYTGDPMRYCNIQPPQKPAVETKTETKCVPECSKGEECLKIFISCLNPYDCNSPKYICSKSNTTKPTGPKCGETVCSSNETCEQALVKCAAGAVCIPPPPKCIPMDPCATELCGHGTVCQAVGSPPTAQCVETVPPCAYTTCQPGYDCYPREDDPTTAECRLQDRCAAMKCKCGYECIARTIYCIRAPCPQPPAQCVLIPPCKKTRCPKGHDCYPADDDPTVAVCRPIDPCSTVKCKPGQRCDVVAVDSLQSPCPTDYAMCNEIHPCDNTTCKEGYVCTQTENDPSVAECVFGPCGYVRCGNNTTCEVFVKNCTEPPCPRPFALCVPKEEKKPCSRTDCKPGFICIDRPARGCKYPPCPKYEPVCIQNPCTSKLCPKGSSCSLDKNKEAVCSTIEPCDTEVYK